MKTLPVTVVVPVKNEAANLFECLAALDIVRSHSS